MKSTEKNPRGTAKKLRCMTEEIIYTVLHFNTMEGKIRGVLLRFENMEDEIRGVSSPVRHMEDEIRGVPFTTEFY